MNSTIIYAIKIILLHKKDNFAQKARNFRYRLHFDGVNNVSISHKLCVIKFYLFSKCDVLIFFIYSDIEHLGTNSSAGKIFAFSDCLLYL